MDINSPSNRELWLNVNTVPSRSLEDDMIESLERMHHRAVTALQMRFHERIGKVEQEAEALRSKVVYAHPYQSFQEWGDQDRGDAVETWVLIERSKMEKMLESMEILLEYKKKQIRDGLDQ